MYHPQVLLATILSQKSKQQVSPGIESKLCCMFVFVFSVLFLNEKG